MNVNYRTNYIPHNKYKCAKTKNYAKKTTFFGKYKYE